MLGNWFGNTDNNRLDDNAAMDLINNNIWDPEKVVFINLSKAGVIQRTI